MGNAAARVNGDTYKILGTLGEGGSAAVYEVLRRGDKRHLALKWVRGVRDAEQLERLQLEIRVHRRLQHAHVLPLVDAEVRDAVAESVSYASSGSSSIKSSRSRGRYAASRTHSVSDDRGGGASAKEVLLLFPICAHGSLQTMLQDSFEKGTAPFSESECLRFFEQLLSAVQHLHDRGFAHRDIKPGNVLLASANPVTPMLMDFGSVAPLSIRIRSAAEHAALCEEAAALSSAPFRPPELWAANGFTPNAVVDGRTDVWQLGCTLYVMAFGPFSPFETARDGVQQLAILNGSVRFPPQKSGPPSCFGDERFSPTFVSFIKWMLIPDIDSRPTLDDVRQQLAQLRAGDYAAAAAAMSMRSITSSLSFSSDTELIGGPTPATVPLVPPPPPTQMLPFSKLASEEWADFAAYEKESGGGSSLSLHSSEDWGEFTGFERSTSTSALSAGTVVWSADAPPEEQSRAARRQSSRRHSIGATLAPPREIFAGNQHEVEHRRALSTRGRLLLSQALDNRASQ